MGGFPVGRDQWGGENVVGGLLPRINIGTCRMPRVGTGTHCPIGFVAKAVPVAWKLEVHRGLAVDAKTC